MSETPEPPAPFALPYTGERLVWALAVIGWSKNELARRLNTDEGSVRQMCRNRRLIPDVLGLWLETLAALHQALPQPMGWRSKAGPRPAVDEIGYGDDKVNLLDIGTD
jgi:transcriptional regulator with XRE-family HTH domain